MPEIQELSGKDFSGLPREEIKRVLREDVKKCSLSREQIAEALSFQVDERITPSRIDDILADSKAHHLPVNWIPAWIRVTGSARVLLLLALGAGFRLANEEEQEMAELGRATLRKEKLEKQVESLKSKLSDKV